MFPHASAIALCTLPEFSEVLGHLLFVRFRKLLALLNCIQTISTTKVKVCQMVLVCYKTSENVRDIMQDDGYGNSYKQQRVKHVVCVFANPSFLHLLHWFHLNWRSRFYFYQLIFQQTYFLVCSLLLHKFLMYLIFECRQILSWACV